MSPTFKTFFAQKDIQILFATAPTGLGHIRVTEALKEALGISINTETIGIMNPTSQFLHRIMSRSIVLRYAMEVFQSNPILEYVASVIYRRRLRTGNRAVRKYLVNIIENESGTKTVVIVATHFGLAHQIASIRKKVERLAHIKLVLSVVVTDDSPQKMWAVDGSDFIFVPSALCARGIRRHLGPKVGATKIVISPYPVSPSFEEVLPDNELKRRFDQTDPSPRERLRILVPVSGAAVQLSYFENVITQLKKKKDIEVSVISRDSNYTKDFLTWSRRQKNVVVESSQSDHEVVSLYEHNLSAHVFSAEITKPSEQTFKALLTPRMRGGVLLLFSGPVGRQEYDNVHFLERHGLLPDTKDMYVLQDLWLFNRRKLITQEFLTRAQKWRGILLPRAGTSAANAIFKLYETGILEAMAHFSGFEKSIELKSNGAELFWKRLQKEMSNTSPLLTRFVIPCLTRNLYRY